MLCNEALECFAPLLVPKAQPRISAQNVYTLCLGQLVVPCTVSAENGPIQIGDLLVTSSTLGVGVIQVLVTLQ